MSIFYSTGAVLVYAKMPATTVPAAAPTPTAATAAQGPGGSGTPVFIGTGEVGPDLETEQTYGEQRNDLGGQRRMDAILDSEDARVSVNFTKWNEARLARLESMSLGGLRGTMGNQDIGTLLVTEGRVGDIWFVFAFGAGASAKPIMTNNGLPAGYHFFHGFLEGPRRRTTGTRANSCAVTFGFLRMFNPTTRGLTIFNHDCSAVAGIAVD